MAKIPRISLGDRPSAVPGGALPAIPGGGVSPIDALGNLAEVGYKIVADSEQQQAAALRDALEKKQAIVDQVGASRAAGDYEEGLVAQVDKLKKDFWNNPDAAPDQLLAFGREAADRQIQAAPNSAFGLDLAQKTASRLDSAVREMHDWAQRRQTQKAQGDVGVTINRAAFGARAKGSLESLTGYMAARTSELDPQIDRIFSPAEAAVQKRELREEMVKSWLDAIDPLAALFALKEPRGPLVDYQNSAARTTAFEKAKDRREGAAKTRDLEAIMTGINSGRELYTLVASGASNAGDALFTVERSIISEQKAVGAKLDLDLKAFKELGIDPAGLTPREVSGVLAERLEYVRALGRWHDRQTGVNAPGDPVAEEAVLRQVDKSLRKASGKDITEIVKQYTRLGKAVASGTVSRGKADTLFQTMALAMDTATANAADPAGLNVYRAWREPKIAGDLELNTRIAAAPKVRNDNQKKNEIRFIYQDLILKAVKDGRNINKTVALELADRAFRLGSYDPEGGE